MKFEKHGEHSISVEGNVVIAHVHGALNYEAACAYIDGLEFAVHNSVEQHYFVLIDLTALEGATPEAWQLVSEHNAKVSRDGRLKGKAIVSSLSFVEKMAKDVNSAMDNNTLGLFDNRESAFEWLVSKGARIN